MDALEAAPGDQPPTPSFAEHVGRWFGHAWAMLRRGPDLLDATRGVARLGLPRRVRDPAVAGLTKIIDGVAVVQLTAERTYKEESK